MIFSSINRIKDCIPYGDAENKNEAGEVQLFRIGVPKNPRCLSSLSFFNLANASSMPCDQLANSCSFTPLSKNSKRSSEIVMLRDFLLRFVTTIHCKEIHKFLNNAQTNLCSAKNIFAGTPNDKINSLSASSADPGRHRFHPHGMSDELLGPRPRGGVGLSPALPHAGTDEHPAGGDGLLPPPALDGPLGSGLRLSGVRA